MSNEQKMREAFEKWGTANTPERERLAFYDGWHARETLATLTRGQLELTDGEIDRVWIKKIPEVEGMPLPWVRKFARAAIAAHEAKRNGGAS